MPESPHEYRYFLGYPRGYARVIALKAGCLVGCLPFALVPVALAAFYFSRFRMHFHIGPLIAFLLSVLLVWLAVAFLYAGLLPPHLLPRFEPKMHHCCLWEGTGLLPRYWRNLDGLAVGQGLRPLSAFGFARAHRGKPEGWHDAAPALETVRRLVQLVRDKPLPGRDAARLLHDLELLEDALSRAARLGHRFHFEITA